MEAQKVDQKPRRMSDMIFAPGFTIEIQMEHTPIPKVLDQEMVITLLMGIDKRNPWFEPNNIGPRVPDPIIIAWVATDGSSKLRCTHLDSDITEKHFDAYLRYIQTIGKLLCLYLEKFGVTHVSVLLDLTACIKEFSVHSERIEGKSSGGGPML